LAGDDLGKDKYILKLSCNIPWLEGYRAGRLEGSKARRPEGQEAGTSLGPVYLDGMTNRFLFYIVDLWKAFEHYSFPASKLSRLSALQPSGLKASQPPSFLVYPACPAVPC
jgi:hypothetical protein